MIRATCAMRATASGGGTLAASTASGGSLQRGARSKTTRFWCRSPTQVGPHGREGGETTLGGSRMPFGRARSWAETSQGEGAPRAARRPRRAARSSKSGPLLRARRRVSGLRIRAGRRPRVEERRDLPLSEGSSTQEYRNPLGSNPNFSPILTLRIGRAHQRAPLPRVSEWFA